MMSALIVDATARKSLSIDVIRDRTTLYQETNKDNIKNVYTLVISNRAPVKQSFTMKLSGLQMFEILGYKIFR
jgi:polyferredoxin